MSRRLALHFLLLVKDKITFLIPWFPLPPSLEALLTRVKAREGMRFCIENDLVERQDIIGAKEEVKVFQRLSLWYVS
jgi:hypothetical protein